MMKIMILIFFYIVIMFVSPALAAPKMDGQVILQYIHEDNRDLGSGDAEPSSSFSEQLYIGLRNTIDRYRSWRMSGRAFNINSHNAFNTDDGEPSNPIVDPNGAFLELREAYYRDKAFMPGIDLQIGRQRLREPRALWWGDNLDLVKLSFKTDKGSGFLGAGEDLGSYRTEQRELARDEKRFRILGEYRHNYSQSQWLEPRFVFEHDHSGEYSAGDVVSYDELDRDDLTGLYAGLRGTGVFEDRYNLHKLFYRGDVIGLTARNSEQEVSSSNGSYQIDSIHKENIAGLAIDGGVSVQPWQDGIVFKAGYAMGSEDFRQTGLEGGTSRNDLERHAQRNYGEVFRPELSNMHIATVGFVYPIDNVWVLGADYYHYMQLEKENDVRRSGLRADPNGMDKALGQELDLRLTADLDNIISVHGLRGVQWRSVVGVFDPGRAYGNDNDAIRVFSEFRVRF